MPLFTDLPSFGYYYSGNVSPYSNHSSIGGSYSRSPYSLSSYSGYSRGYSPLLSTISESRTGVISRINSPKRLHLQSTAKYRAPKPIRINTADIDVSANKYRRERPTPTTTPESHIVYGVSSPNAPSAPLQDGPFMPRAEPHEDDNTNRSTIKRGRTVVRLSTIRSRTSGPPENEGKTNWRRELAQDLTFKDEKKVRKTPGEKLIEKHLIRDKSTENTSSLDVEDEEEEGPLECRGRAPSFHDICKDISSDKLYDDLNAGELRRIADRRKSEDKSTISPIMEVPSEIVDVFNEDGTFHRRTTLKKLRKSTKGIFIHMPDTPHLDPNVGLDINLNKENSCKSPKITASVEVQNSEPSLRAVATEVQVETKHNAQKRKFFYKIVVEDVIEIKPNEKSDTSNEDHNANTLHDIPTNVTEKTALYSKTENISSKELDKEQKKETKEKKKSAKRLSKKSVKTDHRSSKSKIVDDNADNFWDVIGSRESVYYTARRKRILEEQRNRYAFDEIIPEVPDSPSMNSTESDKPIASTGIDHVIKTNCNISNESSSPVSKIMAKNKKNATEQPLDARNQLTEIKSKSVAQITPKVPVQKESIGNSTPSAINKEKTPKASDIPKSTSNESILKPSMTQNSTPLPINKEKSSKVPVIPKTTSNECIPKPSIETQEKDTIKSLNEVPLSPASKAVLQTKSVSKSISPEICPKKEDQIKKTENKNTKGNDVLVSVSPKESAPSVLSSKSVGQENNIVKGDTNIETKPSADIAKSPEVPAEKLPTVSKPRNKKYVKAKTLDLRQNEDTCKELSTKTLPKDQTDKEPTKSNELKKRNSETDISKRSETKSAMGKTEIKDVTPLKSKQTNASVVPTIDRVLPKLGNDLTKEKQAINSNATKGVKSPTINEKIPTNTDMIPNEDKKDKVPTKTENTPSKENVINTNITEVAKDVKASAVIQKILPLEKADVKQNDDKKESSADLKTKKLCKPFVKPTKQIDEVHKSPEIKTTIERNVATTLEAKKADNSVIPATKENVQSKTEKQINKNTVTETTKIMEPQVKIEEKQKPLKGEALKINNEIKNTSADIKSKKSSKASAIVGKSSNEVKSPISDPKTVINNDVQKCVESDNLQNQVVSLEESKSKLNEKVTELSALLHDTSAISVPKISERTPSSHSSGRQSLKSFSERVTERVRNPSLRIVTRQPEEPKLKPSLISMNTSSDLTAIMKEPITPVDKKIKLIPKNEPAPKPLIATPRPLQAIIRNRKAQLHQSIDSDSDDSSDSSWTDSSEEESEESEFFECGSPIDNPIASMENLIATEPSYVYAQFLKTSKIVPPATKIPRFRKYAVEDFNFLKVLGKGSFGKVLLAELKNTEFYYAVKCLNKNIVLEDDDVECTLIERKVLALGTKHPYLCHLFCTFQTESHLFFVMEYLNGGDLMFHIQHSGRFPEPRASFYAAEIVSGLRFLHKKGIVYRDLKLDNILLDFDGHVRIADFGMCKLQIYLDKTADTFCGTPDYMAPEIIKGLKYNQSVDWWSFGVLLYEMLIGQSPFSGCDEDELFWSICNEIPYYPRHLSSEALEILTRFLNKDSEVRLGSGTCPYGDVTEQRFFQDIDWGRLERRQLEPPFKPRVLHPLDTQYFDKAFTGEAARLTPIDEAVIRGMDHDRFHGFSYTNPNATD